jgi:pyridoxine kinase
MPSLVSAVTALHETYKVPHVLVTSVTFNQPGAVPTLSVFGSTKTSDHKPRIFRVQVPSLDCFFSGTGDMFAALMVVRLREAVSKVEGLAGKAAWVSEDDVPALELPLAQAVEKALASMQEVLARTMARRNEELAAWETRRSLTEEQLDGEEEKAKHLRITKAAEVRLVRNLSCLRNPEVKYLAEEVK